MKKITGGLAVLLLAGVAAFVLRPMVFGSPAGVTLAAAQKAGCGITAQVTEGPYYVSGTAALVNGNLNSSNLPGVAIQISGHVYEGLDNTKPLANATIEIWHADATGNYHPNSNGAAANYKPEEIALRGFIKTDASGAYSFSTIDPGEYSGRARHIHIKVKAGGKPELTTQLILAQPGDKISFDEDTVSKGLPTCHLLKLDQSKQTQTASFDFRL